MATTLLKFMDHATKTNGRWKGVSPYARAWLRPLTGMTASMLIAAPALMPRALAADGTVQDRYYLAIGAYMLTAPMACFDSTAVPG